jgi:ATP-dependent Clp protease ATP-binding subunit ClpC
MSELGIEFELSQSTKDFIAEKGWSAQYGARPLKRAIQRYIEDLLAEELIHETVREGDRVLLNYDAEKEDILVNITSSKEESPVNNITSDEKGCE